MRQVVVVGGGVAGLCAALHLIQGGQRVLLVSGCEARRSPSSSAHGGINAAFDLRGEGDSPYLHCIETIECGAFLANQPPVLEMCLAAPHLVRMLDRAGCPFQRHPDGTWKSRAAGGGSLRHRQLYCGASTGQQILNTLDEQLRRYQVTQRLVRFEQHTFCRLIRDETGTSRGVVVLDHATGQLQALRGDAVLLATGGVGMLFERSTNSLYSNGAALGALFMQGMHCANAEFIQLHPFTLSRPDRPHLVPTQRWLEGGRVWVPGQAETYLELPEGGRVRCGTPGTPWYFLEELYPAYGHAVPWDVSTRLLWALSAQGLAIGDGTEVYLDLPQQGSQPAETVKVSPAVHANMGGAWVHWPAANSSFRSARFRQMTNLPGLFAAGECDALYHGASRMSGNGLLSALFAGWTASQEMIRFLDILPCTHEAVPDIVFSQALSTQEDIKRDLLQRTGNVSSYALHDRLAQIMQNDVAVPRTSSGLNHALHELLEIRELCGKIHLHDTELRGNQSMLHALQMRSLVELGILITMSALSRQESRGTHHRLDFPEQKDAEWLRTTIAAFDHPVPQISYRPVDHAYLAPYKREYTHREDPVPVLTDLPAEIALPR